MISVTAAVGPVLHSTIAADQPVIAVASAVGDGAIGPRVIIVVVAAVPAAIAYVGVVVINDGRVAAPTPPAAPVHAPSAPAPGMAAAPASASPPSTQTNPPPATITSRRAREGQRQCDVLADDLRKVLPVIREGAGDTA